MIEPLGVHHVSVNVHDLADALDFYTRVLGLTARTDRPELGIGGAWLDLGEQQVHLIEAPAPDDRGQHFAIRVADIDAAVAELHANGIDVSDPTPIATSRQCFLHDPSGNRIELHEPGVSPAG